MEVGPKAVADLSGDGLDSSITKVGRVTGPMAHLVTSHRVRCMSVEKLQVQRCR